MQNQQEIISNSKKKKLSLIAKFFILLFLLMLAVIIYFVVRFYSFQQSIYGGFQPAEMEVAQYSSKDLHANLGGMEVKIPRYFTEYVSYDDDPGFGEKRKGAMPKRTPQSVLRGFRFDVRYPDMQGLSSWDLRQEKRNQLIRTSMWLSVGITSGEHYPKDGFLDRRLNGTLNPPIQAPSFIYEKLPEQQFGLDVYANPGQDPKTLKLYREHSGARDYYIHKDNDGKVDTFIWCHNSKGYKHGTLSCTQTFGLDPKADVVVNVRFRRDLLSEWSGIQMSVKDLLLGFEVKSNNASQEK